MFKSVHYHNKTFMNCISYNIYYLKNDEFTCNIFMEYVLQHGWIILPAIITEYQKRNLPVAKNVALFYLYKDARGFSYKDRLECNKEYIDTFHPNLNYGSKYYHCVLNQLKMITFGKRR